MKHSCKAITTEGTREALKRAFYPLLCALCALCGYNFFIINSLKMH